MIAKTLLFPVKVPVFVVGAIALIAIGLAVGAYISWYGLSTPQSQLNVGWQ